MINHTPPDNGFCQQSEVVAVAAKVMISKIRRHIEEDGCDCCKKALEINIDIDTEKRRWGTNPAPRK